MKSRKVSRLIGLAKIPGSSLVSPHPNPSRLPGLSRIDLKLHVCGKNLLRGIVTLNTYMPTASLEIYTNATAQRSFSYFHRHKMVLLLPGMGFTSGLDIYPDLAPPSWQASWPTIVLYKTMLCQTYAMPLLGSTVGCDPLMDCESN